MPKIWYKDYKPDVAGAAIIAGLIETNILAGLDDDAWEEAMAREKNARQYLTKIGEDAPQWEGE